MSWSNIIQYVDKEKKAWGFHSARHNSNNKEINNLKEEVLFLKRLYKKAHVEDKYKISKAIRQLKVTIERLEK